MDYLAWLNQLNYCPPRVIEVTEIYRYLMKVSNKKIGSCLHRSSHKFANRAEVYVRKQLAPLAEVNPVPKIPLKEEILSPVCRGVV